MSKKIDSEKVLTCRIYFNFLTWKFLTGEQKRRWGVGGALKGVPERGGGGGGGGVPGGGGVVAGAGGAPPCLQV